MTRSTGTANRPYLLYPLVNTRDALVHALAFARGIIIAPSMNGKLCNDNDYRYREERQALWTTS